MSYTVTITTARGRTFTHSVGTLEHLRLTINRTHLARLVRVLDNSTGEYFDEQEVLVLADPEILV
jgi:hypothetical protein